MKQPRILIVGNGATGVRNKKEYLINTHSGKFLTELNKQFDVTFLQYSSKYDKNNDLQNFDLDGNRVNHVELNGNKNIRTFLTIIDLIKKHDFIYIFYPGTLGKIVGVFSILLGKKHGMYVRGEGFNVSQVDKLVLRKSDFILTVSNHFKDSLLKFCKKVYVIKPMIAITKGDFFKRDYSNFKVNKFLFVGRVEENKGIFELIEIMRLINKVHPIEVDIVGGGDKYNKVLEIIATQNLHFIKLHGLISDKEELKKMYNQSDGFLFTSHFEGFPRVLYEAMASGLPIYTTFVGGIPGLMKNNYNCLEIPVKDSLRASEVILSTFDNTNLLKEISINGQNTLTEILDGDNLEHDKLLANNIK